ncbi:hypothetical protein ACJIZ3_011976 [Penstemon smallii]|uniref:Uncharacterized protein n=1 Tax=Penstemon smallii TaxID=265156 RepID=A0ABD3UKN7_9LAMI
MDFEDEESVFSSILPPSLVSLTPFSNSSVSPSPRRLSSCFTQPNKPVRAKRQLAWVSLQGRLVGAEEASSAKTIDRNGALSPKEAAAWELFTPIQRVLTVAVASAAATNSNKNKQILKLQKSVELRDQVLSSMQQKLDNLCEQVNYFKDQPEILTANDVSVAKMGDCGCKPCMPHTLPPNYVMDNSSAKGSHGDEVLKYKSSPPTVAEPEERRMSDLSDWAPSVTSSFDSQLDTLSIEHDIISLQKECEEKDATIKELSDFLRSSEVLGSKRIAELEDIVRRKNMIINKLRKDMLVLEQKVINLTRLGRPSFSAASSNAKPLPLMADNVLYDMDSTTSPSSSDSDSPRGKQIQIPAYQSPSVSVQIIEKDKKADQKPGQVKSSTCTEQHQRSCESSKSPLKERSMNQTPNSVPALKSKHTSTTSGENRTRRRPPVRSKELTAPKRWA